MSFVRLQEVHSDASVDEHPRGTCDKALDGVRVFAKVIGVWRYLGDRLLEIELDIVRPIFERIVQALMMYDTGYVGGRERRHDMGFWP